MRTRLALAVLLLLSLSPVYAAGPENCPAFKPSEDLAKWTWMDRGCHIRTGADLDRILACHKLWLKKYAPYLLDGEALEANGAFGDPLRADLRTANLTGAVLNGADLVRANLNGADLTRASLDGADLTGAYLDGADLTGAWLLDADLTGAYLDGADLTGAYLKNADLTGSFLDGADLSSSFLSGADFSDADLTEAKLWYADFEPKVPPPANSIARTEGLETLRWQESTDELYYRHKVEMSPAPGSTAEMPTMPTLPGRWLVWLSRYREIQNDQSHSWRNEFRFLWSDVFHGLQPHRPEVASSKGNSGTEAGGGESASGSPGKEPEKIPTAAQNQYSLIDLRDALKKAGYTEAELHVNLAYKRRSQSTLGMILYDWTCAYGAAPARPLVIALVLALLAVPLYWVGFRHQLFGGHLLLVEKQDGKDIETPLGDPLGRPDWQGRVRGDDRSLRAILKEISKRAPAKSASTRFRMARFVASCWPRVRWEAAFLKAVVLFSLMSMVNLGFQGLDFGRWVRNFFFREYDLKARGWLRAVSGLQSLVGLGLLALSLLSFFGHPFE